MTWAGTPIGMGEGMGRPPQMFEPGVVYEITTRTLRGELKLRPGEEVNAIVLAVIGRALFLFKAVQLYYFVTLSNHLHMLLSAKDGESLTSFIRFVNSNISTRVGDLLEDPGTLWTPRARRIAVVDEASMVGRLKYLLAHGCKEGLVSTPAEWPGASAYAAFIGDMTMDAVWHDRNGENQARRSTRRRVDTSRFVHQHPIELTPIPPFASLEPSARRARHVGLVERVIAEENARHVQLGRIVLGVAKVLAQNPRSRPARLKRSPPPLCHATTSAAREAYRVKYRAFVAAYRAASAALRAGRPAEFPPGSYPCRARWVPLSPAGRPALH